MQDSWKERGITLQYSSREVPYLTYRIYGVGKQEIPIILAVNTGTDDGRRCQ